MPDKKDDPFEIDAIGYDAEKQLVLIEGGACREDYFIRYACIYYQRYGRNKMFLWAVINALPGLLENPTSIDIFRRLVAGEPLRKHGQKIAAQYDADKRQKEVFKRVWFWIGAGLPVHQTDEYKTSPNTACKKAAEDTGISVTHAYKIWVEVGTLYPQETEKRDPHTPQGAPAIVAFHAKAAGAHWAKQQQLINS